MAVHSCLFGAKARNCTSIPPTYGKEDSSVTGYPLFLYFFQVTAAALVLSFFKGAPQAVHRGIGFQHRTCFAIFHSVFDKLRKKRVNNQSGDSAGLKIRIDRNEKHLKSIVFSLQRVKQSENSKRESLPFDFFSALAIDGIIAANAMILPSVFLIEHT